MASPVGVEKIQVPEVLSMSENSCVVHANAHGGRPVINFFFFFFFENVTVLLALLFSYLHVFLKLLEAVQMRAPFNRTVYAKESRPSVVQVRACVV